jgi:hypothetical protein
VLFLVSRFCAQIHMLHTCMFSLPCKFCEILISIILSGRIIFNWIHVITEVQTTLINVPFHFMLLVVVT